MQICRLRGFFFCSCVRRLRPQSWEWVGRAWLVFSLFSHSHPCWAASTNTHLTASVAVSAAAAEAMIVILISGGISLSQNWIWLPFIFYPNHNVSAHPDQKKVGTALKQTKICFHRFIQIKDGSFLGFRGYDSWCLGRKDPNNCIQNLDLTSKRLT